MSHLIAIVAFLSLLVLVAFAAAPEAMPDTWEAVDALGRKVATRPEAPAPRPGKFVGIFYWTWHVGAGEPYNVTKIITEHPEALTDYEHPAWGPWSAPHHWNEPLFGFYRSTDRWVLRKHAEMLAAAGVDAVFFDCTNGTFTWDEQYRTLCEVWTEARKDGVRTPQIAFMLPFGPSADSLTSLKHLYTDLYKPGKWRDLWFIWKGKPLIMAYPDNLTDVPGDEAETQLRREIRAFFTFRPGQPDYVDGPRRNDQWGWLENYPQHGYVKLPDGGFEQVTVGVAQNAGDISGGHCSAFNLPDSYGRSYTRRNGHDRRPDAHMYGLNFAEQWDRAFELDPQFVFITGWNEWVAGRHKHWGMKDNAFPDQYDTEHSRDIEPMKGGHGDNYYYQMVDKIRRFKGVREQPKASAPKTIRIGGPASQWDTVGPDFRSWPGNTKPRDAQGYGSTHYTNNTGRNDIVRARVARDRTSVYFMVECAAPITPETDPNWMWLLISVTPSSVGSPPSALSSQPAALSSPPSALSSPPSALSSQLLALCSQPSALGSQLLALSSQPSASSPDWNGFHFILNRTAPGVLEVCTGGWNWKPVGRVRYAVKGNRLEVAIPRRLLGLDPKRPLDFAFKWADNVQKPGDIMDFYLSGDVAPLGRFVWRWRE
ncbi:MAG: hypothetical protein GX446_01060 [Chthonomonadales bacterium]|nr:hypothetical protein [Chthonomonadales bacterium]